MAESATISAPSMYSPLLTSYPYNERPIRLLRILPDGASDVMRCELQVTELADSPPFEALSYVWGGLEPAEVIICNTYPKYIAPNLAAA